MQRHELTQDNAKVQTQMLTQHKSFASKNKICTWWVLPYFFISTIEKYHQKLYAQQLIAIKPLATHGAQSRRSDDSSGAVNSQEIA